MSARPLVWDGLIALLAACAALGVPLPWTVLALVCFLGPGLAHGALDARLSPRRGAGFYLLYLLGMALSAGVWLCLPGLGLAVFVGLAAWHFGEAELSAHTFEGSKAFAYLTRGAVLLGGPLALRLPEARPILDVMGIELPPIPEWFRWGLAAFLLLVHLSVLLRAMPRPRWARELFSLIAALSLMATLPLLEGFVLWFSIGHAGAHLVALRSKDSTNPSGLILLKEALPTWGVALIGLLALAFGLGAQGADARGWAAAFVGLAVLTTPHMLIVARWHSGLARSASHP